MPELVRCILCCKAYLCTSSLQLVGRPHSLKHWKYSFVRFFRKSINIFPCCIESFATIFIKTVEKLWPSVFLFDKHQDLCKVILVASSRWSHKPSCICSRYVFVCNFSTWNHNANRHFWNYLGVQVLGPVPGWGSEYVTGLGSLC